jgi:hypothetical protein
MYTSVSNAEFERFEDQIQLVYHLSFKLTYLAIYFLSAG